MRWKEENKEKRSNTSQGERKKVGECCVTEPRLEKEGGVHRAGVTKRSVRGQKCPLELPGKLLFITLIRVVQD